MDSVYTRLEYLFTIDELNKIKNAKVCIVGLGGVGGMAAESLARCGVGTLVLMDFDKVNITNTNRQVIANSKNIGNYKTKAFKEMINDINKDINVITITEKFDESTSLFNYDFDYIIDAIDDVNNKFLLIKESLERNKTIISSMGTAKKYDLTKLRIVELQKTSYDPIAKILRRKFRENNINKKLYVVSSTEEVIEGTKLGSYMPVVSTAGLLCSDYIIKKIINKN